jgi:hypothetical protein
MSDLEQRIRAFEQERTEEENLRASEFKRLVQPTLPLAILFCNEQGQKMAKTDQLQSIFGGQYATRYNALEEEIKGLEFVSYLASYVGGNYKAQVRDVFIIAQANEKGFQATQLMNYFQPCFYLTSLDQARFLQKLGFIIEEQKYLNEYARQTQDRLWEIYNYARESYIAMGLTPELMRNSYQALDKIRYTEDALQVYLRRIILQLEKN